MADPTLLFHLSDIHFGLEHNRSLDWVAGEITARKPAAVIITGDLTMRARTREFTAARNWILDLDAPVTVEVGNHDLPYFNLVERFFDPYRRFRGMELVVEKELELPGIAIIPLKTTVRMQPRLNWSKGWVSGAALDKCLAAIDALPTDTKVLVTVHHPLVEVGTRGTAMTRGGTRALAELARRNVVAVLSGHVHDPFDITQADRKRSGADDRRGHPLATHPLHAAELQRVAFRTRRHLVRRCAQPAARVERGDEDRRCARRRAPAARAGRARRPDRRLPRTDPPVH